MRPHARWLTLFTLAALVARGAAAELRIRLEDQKHEPIPDGVVWLTPLDGQSVAAASVAAPVEIEQKDQEFLPLVTVVRVGTKVQLPNRDSVEHHVYSQSPAKRFEFPLYAPHRSESVIFDRPGIVALGCNIHDWMLAYVVVVDTDWFCRTDADGTGTIRRVPPGRYRVEVWNRRLAKTEKREITVRDGAEPLTFALTLKPDRRIRRPVSTERGGYR